MMKKLEELEFNGKIAIIRCDFNLPINEKGEILDDFRIRETLPTICEIINRGGKAVLISHAEDNISLEILVPTIEDLLKKKIRFINNFTEKTIKAIKQADRGSIFLLENLRIHDGEKNNDQKFAEELARLGDIYVNEAFSVCHREHASMVKLPEILPHCAGLNLIKEVKVLAMLRDNPLPPFVAIIGGSKVSSKIKTVKYFINKASHILFGGKVANEILIIKGISPNRPWPDEEIVKEAESIELTSRKIHLPVDVIVAPLGCDNCTRIDAPGQVRMDEDIFDIGPETIRIYSEIIKEARTIIWAGPLGLFEKKEFERGTREIANAIARNNNAFRVIGGGDTGMAINKFNLMKSVDHVSTGGGAMLDFMAGRELPGLRALGYYENLKIKNQNSK